MKKIIISQENIEPVIIIDDDNTDINSYTKKLSEIYKMSSIVILNTTTKTVILRPSKIISIEVEDIDDPSSLEDYLNDDVISESNKDIIEEELPNEQNIIDTNDFIQSPQNEIKEHEDKQNEVEETNQENIVEPITSQPPIDQTNEIDIITDEED